MTCKGGCNGCPYQGYIGFSEGPKDSPFVIVGEYPEGDDVRAKRPFAGRAGLVLQDALKQAGHPQPYITYAIKCRPGNFKNKDLLDKAVLNCRQNLLQELQAHPRKVILTLGDLALKAVTGDLNLKTTKERGKVLNGNGLADYILPAFGPYFLLRGSGNYRQFKADMAYALHLANGGDVRRVPEVRYSVFDHPDEITEVARYLKSLPANTVMANDLETDGFDFRDNEILSIGFAVDPSFVFIVPEEMVPYSRPLYQNNLRQVWHNGKFDIKFLRAKGIPEAYTHEDTMLMSYALDERGGVHDLETVSHDWLGSPNWKAMLDQHLPKKSMSYRVIPRPVLFKYQAYDISNTLLLHNILRPLVSADPVTEKLYTKTLIPASEYLSNVETNGFYVDKDRVKENLDKMQAEADSHEARLNQLAMDNFGHGVNPRSPIQLGKLLFDEFKIPVKVRATDVDTLDKLPPHPAVDVLKAYRKVHKGLSTYVVPYTENLSSDGAVHTTYLIHGTATGRLSSRSPNLQNIPRNPQLRGQLIARPGRLLIEADLSQAELRSLACLSNDPVLCHIYETDGMSLHDEVRAEIFGNPEDWSENQLHHYFQQFNVSDVKRVLEEQKMKAKNVNFGIVYGITNIGLAEQAECSPKDAQAWLDAWAKKFSAASAFINMCRAAPAKGQNLLTPFGRRKRHHIVTPEILGGLQNEAANFPHQSAASDIMLHAGISLEPRLREEFDCLVVNTVHDSVIIDAPNDYQLVQTVANLVMNELEEIPRRWGITRIPFKADAKVGTRWGNLTDYHKWLAANDPNNTETAAA